MAQGGIERRIGRRRQIRSVPMAWCRDPSNPDPYLADLAPDGRIVELSVSGAGMVAITHPYLAIGSKVIISAAGVAGTVLVRRIEADLYPGESYYGVEFAEPNSRLGAVLHETFVARETDAPTVFIPKG
jgi:hypothetical protein